MPRPNEYCEQCERHRPCGPDGLCHECRVKLDDIERDIDFTETPQVEQGNLEPAGRKEQDIDVSYVDLIDRAKAHERDRIIATQLPPVVPMLPVRPHQTSVDRLLKRHVVAYVKALDGRFYKDAYGDLIVKFGEDTYHTNDLLDALQTARCMKGSHPNIETAENELPEGFRHA